MSVDFLWYVKVQSPKKAVGTPPQTLSFSQLEEKCAMLENEKEHLETKLDVSKPD